MNSSLRGLAESSLGAASPGPGSSPMLISLGKPPAASPCEDGAAAFREELRSAIAFSLSRALQIPDADARSVAELYAVALNEMGMWGRLTDSEKRKWDEHALATTIDPFSTVSSLPASLLLLSLSPLLSGSGARVPFVRVPRDQLRSGNSRAATESRPACGCVVCLHCLCCRCR